MNNTLISIGHVIYKIKNLLDHLLTFLWIRKRSVGTTHNLFQRYNKVRITDTGTFCFAPFKSLYFNSDGKVLACCYNRIHVLGNYPEQCIHEIWNGKKIQELRSALQFNDLTSGCLLCLNQLEEKTFSTILARNYDPYPLGKFPSVMEFDLANICNMACIMCDGNHSSLIKYMTEKLPPVQNPYDNNFLKELEVFIPHLRKAKFLGGEPFLIPIYYNIWEKIIELNPNCVISVQTNGSVLNERIKSLMGKGNFHFNASIDAISKEVYETIRLKGDFQKVMANVQYFRSYCKKNNAYFGVSVCPMQQNWVELPEIVRYCNFLEAEVTFNRVWYPPHCALSNCTEEKLITILNHYKKVHLEGKSWTSRYNKKRFDELINQIKMWIERGKTNETNLSVLEQLDDETLKDGLLKKMIQQIDTGSLHRNSVEKELLKTCFDKVLSVLSTDIRYRPMLIKLYDIPIDVLAKKIIHDSEDVIISQAREYLKES